MLVTKEDQQQRSALLEEMITLRAKQRADWTHVEAGTSEVLDWLYSLKEDIPAAAKTLAYIENLLDTMAIDRDVINKLFEYINIADALIAKENQFALAEVDLCTKMLDKNKSFAKFILEREKLIQQHRAK